MSELSLTGIMCGPEAYKKLMKTSPDKTYRTEENEDFVSYLLIWEWAEWSDRGKRADEVRGVGAVLDELDRHDAPDDYGYAYKMVVIPEDLGRIETRANTAGVYLDIGYEIRFTLPCGARMFRPAENELRP